MQAKPSVRASRNRIHLIMSIVISLALIVGAFATYSARNVQAAPLAAAVSVGLGSYNTTLPSGGLVPSNSNGAPVAPKITANVTGPIPTNDWWSSLVWQRYAGNPYGENLYALPLSLKAKNNGMGISYATTPGISTGSPAYIGEYHFTYNEDFTAGLVGLNSPDSKVDGHSDWAVTAQLSDGTNTLKSTFGHGMPYAYFTKTGGNAQLTFVANPTVWSNSNGVLGVTINGHHYGIFAPAGSTWTITNAILQSSLAGKDYFSIAVLPDNTAATLSFYQSRAYAFVTGTTVSWNYNQSTSKVTTTYTATTTVKEGTNTNTLMGLYRVHWLNTADALTSYSYVGPHGTIKVRDGNSFSTNLTFNGVLPAMPDSGDYDRTRLNGYVNSFAATTMFPAGTGTYWTGKNLMRAANVAMIADQLGNTSARDTILAGIKSKMQDWFQAPDGKTANMFYYNNQWGTLIGYPAEYGSDAELNDHHFHYAYYIYAAAIVARYDPTWASNSNWGGMVNLLIKDAANISTATDNRFPRLRNFDPYEGYAWAAGHAGFGSGNNQESSSESMNFNTALILWGSATGDTATRDLGVYMYVNEVQAIEQNWFDINDAVFPSAFRANHEAVGMNWGDGGAYATWFSANPEMIQGINMLPITGGSLYLGRNPAYLQANYNQMVANIGGPERYWKDIFWEVQALYDANTAATKFDTVAFTSEEGETSAHTYHWIRNLKVLGQLDTTITANIPTYAVFNKAGVRTYVAYNPGSSSIVVSFSNGVNCTVAAKQLLSSTTCVSGPTPTVTKTQTTGPTPTNSLTPTITQTATITKTPTVTNTPSAVTSNLLYVIDGAAQGVGGVLSASAGAGAATDTIPSAGGGNFASTPNNPLTYTLSPVTGSYDATKTTSFNLFIDSLTGVGNGIAARVSYDFTGDGSYDRVETYNYFPTDPVAGYELYTQTQGQVSATGTFANLVNGKVRVEIWNAIGTTTALVRTSATSANGQQSSVTIPYIATVAPTATVTRTNTPVALTATPTKTLTRTNTPPAVTSTATRTATRTNTPANTATRTATALPSSNLLYVIDGTTLAYAAGTGALTDTIASAGGGTFVSAPNNPITYTISGVTRTYAGGSTAFNLYLDSLTAVGNGIAVRVSYDFTGDGTYDRVETYNYFPTDPVAGYELYTQTRGLVSATGSFANLSNGRVRIEVWNAIGVNTALLRTSATSANGQQSTITLPY